MTTLDDAYKIAVEGTIEQATREAAVVALSDVVQGTPVGNPDLWQGSAPPGYSGGHARRNWLVSISQPDEKEVEGEDAGGGETIRDGSDTAEGFQITDTRIVLHNSVPYIQRLNDGWSSQAPAGFVEASVDRTAAFISRKYG